MYQGVDIVDIFDMADFLMNLFRKNLAEKNDDKEPLNLKNDLGSPKIHLEKITLTLLALLTLLILLKQSGTTLGSN